MSAFYYGDALTTARRLYIASRSGIDRYRAGQFVTSVWSCIASEIQSRAAGANNNAAGHLAANGSALIPVVRQWLAERNVHRLSFITSGSDAMVFEAKLPGNEGARVVLRVGDYHQGGKDTAYERIWCPLVLQPYQRAGIVDGPVPWLSAELSPLIGVRLAAIPMEFINDNILVHTPYDVKVNKDVGWSFSGSSLFVDPDCVGYKSPEAAKNMLHVQHTRDWQQGVMEQIAINCERARWPVNFWLARTNRGFETRQEATYPNPWPHMPARQTFDLADRSPG